MLRDGCSTCAAASAVPANRDDTRNDRSAASGDTYGAVSAGVIMASVLVPVGPLLPLPLLLLLLVVVVLLPLLPLVLLLPRS